MEPQKSNLNRSFSEPDFQSNSTFFRRVFVEEFYQPQNYEKPLIKQYSYSQIIGNSANVSTLVQSNYLMLNKESRCVSEIFSYGNMKQNYGNKNKDKYLCFPDDQTCENKITQNFEENKLDRQSYKLEDFEKHHTERQEIPMDIDNYDDDNVDNVCIEQTREFKNLKAKNVRHLKDTCIRLTQKDNNYKIISFKIVSAVLVIVLAWLYYILFTDVQSSKIELIDSVRLDLDKVLYQDHVKDITIRNLNNLHEDTKFKKILVFVGTTGVGKTHVVNLIRKHFPQKYVVDINILLESHLNVDSVKASLRSDGCYFITIDDLKIDNLYDITSYINKLPDKCMLIVPIFNIHDVDDSLVYSINYDHFKKIEEEFTIKFSSNANVILFNSINRGNLELWLQNQIKEKGLLNKDDVIISLLDEHDVKIYGFKGLAAKINVLES